MKIKTLSAFLILWASFLYIAPISAQSPGDIIEYEKIATFTVDQVDSLVSTTGLPTFLLDFKYDVDFYKVLYYSPYRHPDSLVQASGGLAIATGAVCDLPMTIYGHGTTSTWSSSASRMAGQQWEVGVAFASLGGIVAIPDYLGLGYPDPKVQVHPYQHLFSQANSMVNGIRSARHVCDSVGIGFSDQLFIYGYSQGGFSAAACVREIELNYPDEFNITASAPMSGALDMKGAQVDLMALTTPFSVPGYLPFVIFGYQEFYQNLFSDPSHVFKAPYDTVLPPLYYGMNHGIGYIDGFCDPIPREMIVDTLEANFFADTAHFFRSLLADNDVIDGWVPQAPMRLFYCTEDEQVNYLNSVNAYDKWTAAGAPNLSIQNTGPFGHVDCAPLAFLSGKLWFDTFLEPCVSSNVEALPGGIFSIHPNPAKDRLKVTMTSETPFRGKAVISDLLGRNTLELYAGQFLNHETLELDISQLPAGLYVLSIQPENGAIQPYQEKIWVR